MSDAGRTLHTHPKRIEACTLLNVSQLREQLERIERHGGGQWEIDVVPGSGVPTTVTGQDDLAFDLRRYGVTSADALGDGSQDFVALKFSPAPPYRH
jgi:hypothetical protein